MQSDQHANAAMYSLPAHLYVQLDGIQPLHVPSKPLMSIQIA